MVAHQVMVVHPAISVVHQAMTTAVAVSCIEEVDGLYVQKELMKVELVCKEMMAWDISCTSSGWVIE